jgi:hypothetical protein
MDGRLRSFSEERGWTLFRQSSGTTIFVKPHPACDLAATPPRIRAAPSIVVPPLTCAAIASRAGAIERLRAEPEQHHHPSYQCMSRHVADRGRQGRAGRGCDTDPPNATGIRALAEPRPKSRMFPIQRRSAQPGAIEQRTRTSDTSSRQGVGSLVPTPRDAGFSDVGGSPVSPMSPADQLRADLNTRTRVRRAVGQATSARRSLIR